MTIDELIAELKEYGIENKIEPITIHSTKIQLMLKTIEDLQNELTGYKLSNQSLANALDKTINEKY